MDVTVNTDPFRTRDHVADFDEIVRDFVGRSETIRSTLEMAADIAYGPGPSDTLDLFFPPDRGQTMPVHLFVHGGYWRMFSKRDYSYIARSVTEAGAIAAIVDYALMPAVRMDHIVDQVRRAKRWILDNIGEHGGDPQRLSVSGHSAGAHLATFLFHAEAAPSRVRGALLLGGLYDLNPLQSSFLQPLIDISDQEVAAFSPMDHRHDPMTKAVIEVGADETAPFHAQAQQFSARLRGQGLDVVCSTVAGRNHMSSVRDLGDPDTPLGAKLVDLITSC